ncbi:tRNA pseudouridine(13) synthase TruD [Candidatus Woesearchaeota archaeon]|nr:tRNA pseudouridine(13) synthase TruD [Candidatus Woesearchaeota archaeon]
MYTIKQIPGDFVVIEESIVKPSKEGHYAYFKLWKKEYTTLRAIEHLAEFLHMPQKDIGFAGSKDKEAITEQVISIKNGNASLAEKFKRDDLKLTFLGYGKVPISLGDLKGNHFEIVIRNLDHAPQKVGFITNYFDDQRFSTSNAAIGKAMIQGKFEEASTLINEKSVQQHLEEEPKDFVGALSTLPFKTLQLYIHAYQSLLFNQAVNEYLQCKYSPEELIYLSYAHGKLACPKKQPENMAFPLVGFGVAYPNKEIETIYKRLLKHDGLTERSFVVRAFPDLSAEGDTRALVVNVQNLKIEKLEDDDLNTGKKKCKVSFFLQKGSYATLVIKRMMVE